MSQAENLCAFAKENGIPSATPQEEQNGLPRILTPGGAITLSASAEALYKHVAPSKKLFIRDGRVFMLVEKDRQFVLDQLTPPAACSRFEKHVRFYQMRNGSEVPTTISRQLAEQFLAAEEARQLPQIAGLLNFPVLVERNGNLMPIAEGYDETTQLLVVRPIQLPDVTIESAILILKGVLADFDFQTASDRSRALASIITPALKLGGFIRGAIPADIAEADQSQSGKTYRQKIIAAIYNERFAMITKKESTGVGSLEESFSSALL